MWIDPLDYPLISCTMWAIDQAGKATILCSPSDPLRFPWDLLGHTFCATWSQSFVFLYTFCHQQHFQNFLGFFFLLQSQVELLLQLSVPHWLHVAQIYFYLFPLGLINVLLQNYQECSTSYWCGEENVNLNWTSIWRNEVILFQRLKCSPFPWSLFAMVYLLPVINKKWKTCSDVNWLLLFPRSCFVLCCCTVPHCFLFPPSHWVCFAFSYALAIMERMSIINLSVINCHYQCCNILIDFCTVW